jgi:predicted AAA+ superfamily ATPase
MAAFDSVLEENWQPYLAWGEFPYLENLPGWEEKREYVLEFVIRKVLEVDLPKLKKFNGSELFRLMEVLVMGSGQLVEMKNLGDDLGLSQNTLRDYLSILEKTYLISQVFNKRTGYRTRSVRQRKIYVNSVNAVVLRSGLTFDPHVWQTKAGIFVENYVFNYLKHLQGGEINFWRERQVREVDFVYDYQGSKLPIEVKYQSQIRPDDLKNISYFCGREKLNKAVVITRNKIGAEKLGDLQIQFVPAHYLV